MASKHLFTFDLKNSVLIESECNLLCFNVLKVHLHPGFYNIILLLIKALPLKFGIFKNSSDKNKNISSRKENEFGHIIHLDMSGRVAEKENK